MDTKSPSYKKIINSWAMYDWANSAYITVIVAAVYPPFYRSAAISAGYSESDATAMWAYTASLALALVCLAGPVLGAISDHMGKKKSYLALSMAAGVIFTGSLVFTDSLPYLVVSALFIVSNIGYSASILFYESLLPHITSPEDVDRVSTRGYMLGYLGGGLLLLLDLVCMMHPDWFGLPDVTAAVKASLISVSIWWALFTLPLLKYVPEPEMKTGGALSSKASLLEGFLAGCGRIYMTIKEATRYRQLLLFLPAFWLYYEAIGTIIKMSTAYGDEIGIDRLDMVTALLLTQFIGVPCTIIFGKIAGRISAKKAVLCGLSIYAIAISGAFFMTSAIHFYLLAVLIGLAQGGTQALSRSLFSVMVPRTRSAEFFGLFSTSEKAAGIFGPLLFGLTSQITGHSRFGIIILGLFLLAGMFLLSRVDVEKGMREAASKDMEMFHVHPGHGS